MSTVALVGATGYTGRLVAGVAVGRGHELVLVGRDATALRGVAADHGDRVRDVRVADASDPTALAAATAGVDVVISSVGGDEEAVHATRRMAVVAGRPLVDTAADDHTVRRAVDELADDARSAGLPVVPGVGWRTLFGELLAVVAAERVDRPREVHAAYVVPDRGGLTAASSRGERLAFGAGLRRPMPVRHLGTDRQELPGEERRLAWFPRPIGPHHAAGVAGLESWAVPVHLPTLRTVRTYLAVSSLRAEGLQALANTSRWAPVRRTVDRVLGRGEPGSGPTAEQRRASRWACVVEVEGEDGLARGWANGRDPHGTTALAAVLVAEAALRHPGPGGVIPPGRVAAPRTLLDAIAGASEVRWSVSRPEPRA
jgi:short subunit dehydrogenase-like uncharacterized protein